MLQCTLDWQAFLKEYWQKQPVLLRGMFPEFRDPITPDELAGLAMEEHIDSRLVSHLGGQWQVRHGPFAGFEELGERNWSLLVQAVDHWNEPVADLMAPFRILPNWRIEDLMISFSVPGGGVGPHLDQYDVFIIQGLGRRRWRVGAQQPLKEKVPHPDLLQVEQFEAIIDAELQPGDVLYIPPGFPHDGYAIQPSLNYSVGFRAPNQRDLFSSLADHLLANELGNQRYGDPERISTQHPGQLLNGDIGRLKALMQQLLSNDDLLGQWLGEYLSQNRHELDLAPADPPYQEGELLEALEQGTALRRLGGLRCLYHGNRPEHIYLRGEAWPVPEGAAPLACSLCDAPRLESRILLPLLQTPVPLAWLTMLVNEGYWYLEAAETDEA